MEKIEDEQGNPWHKEEDRQRRLNQGINGAWLCQPFQCEECHIMNLEGRTMVPADRTYARCIRRAQLDAMNGKSHRTIDSHRQQTTSVIKLCSQINKTPTYQSRGPFPLGDQYGMGLAADMLAKSLVAKGRLGPQITYSTMRKLRGTNTKNYDSSPLGVSEGASFSHGAGRTRPTSCPSQSEWMQDFLRGAEYRMGHESAADHGVSITVIVEALKRVKADALEAEEFGNQEEADALFMFGAYLCLCTSASLRGYEGFYLCLAGTGAHINTGRDGVIPRNLNKGTILTEEMCQQLPHVALYLQGQFKAEGGINQHVINIANVSASGLENRYWLEKALDVCAREGRSHGPVFADSSGKLIPSGDFNILLRKYFAMVQEETDLIPAEIDVNVHYSTNRTMRKSAVTRAARATLSKDLQDDMNRWKKVEKSKNKRTQFNMRQLYSGAVLLMPVTWLYSYAL